MAEWITTEKAAEESGYTRRRIRQLINEGQIEGRKWGRDWQVKRSSLLAYIQKAEKLGKKRGPKPDA